MRKLLPLFCFSLISFDSYADINVSDAWLRAPIPGQNNTVGYLQLRNTGDTARQLIAVENDFSARAELHTQQISDGLMQMRKLDKIDIAPHGSVALVSGGHHIMFLQLKASLDRQEKWPLTLVFSDGERISVDLAVRSLSDLAPQTHSHHQH